MTDKDEVAALLEAVSGFEARPYFTYDFGQERDPSGVSIVVDAYMGKTPQEIVDRVRQKLPRGWVAFVGTNTAPLGETYRGLEVSIGPGESQFDIIRLARTDGINHGVGTADIVAALEGFDRLYGIEITHAASDSVSFKLSTKPADLERFARELTELCPDTLADGFEAFLSALHERDRVGLWWD
jgi:hypothetical protein